MKIIVHPLRVKYAWIINYCYLVINPITNTAILIDPAWELETIQTALQQYRSKLCGILLTHHHFDHINLAEPLATKYQVPVFMSKEEIDFYKFECLNLNPIIEQQPIMIGGINIYPLFTPGHTHGGTSYLIENNLFCGDTLFIEGCGMCSCKGANPEVLFHTIELLKQLPLHTLVYPGHSYGKAPGKSLEYVMENNIYLHFKESKNFVEYRMRKNQKGLFNFK